MMQSYLLAYAVNAVWQVPVIALAAAGIAALAGRGSGGSGAVVRHRVWVTALIVEAVLPGSEFHFSGWFRGGGNGAGDGIQVGIASHVATGFHLPLVVLFGLTAVYLGSVLYFALRLIYGLVKTRQLLACAEDLDWPVAELHGVRIAATDAVSGPVTLGLRRPALLVPRGFLEGTSEEDKAALFAHEAAHLRRHDFALNLLYNVIALPVAVHPALWFTRARLAETREMVCDELAAGSMCGVESYTESLLRLAASLSARPPAMPLHAIGLLDANSFERRLMHLTELTSKPLIPSRTRRVVLASTCVVLAVATCASALALHVAAPTPAGQAHLSGSEQAMRIVHKQMPVYPAEAKANHDTMDGPVVLHVLIGKEGSVTDISVKQSLREDYDKSALEAVSHWRWEPYVLDGAPTEVDTDVTVTYSIDHTQDKK